MDEYQNTRNVPINEIDLQMMLVDTEWGKDISPELMERLTEIGMKLEKDKDGKFNVPKKKLWGLLSYYTRDMRLGNLDKQTYVVAVEWLDFAGDSLRIGLIKSFLTSLSRVITMLELSQSRGGFLRKRLGTFTQEHYNEFNESDKKTGLFGTSKKNNRGNE
jgi:hypothetical protein